MFLVDSRGQRVKRRTHKTAGGAEGAEEWMSKL